MENTNSAVVLLNRMYTKSVNEQTFENVIKEDAYSLFDRLLGAYRFKNAEQKPEVDKIIEPVIGDPDDPELLPVMLQNPGKTTEALHSWKTGSILHKVMKEGDEYLYSKFAKSNPYQENNRILNNVAIMVGHLNGQKIQRHYDRMLQLELFPFHSGKFGEYTDLAPAIDYWNRLLLPMVENVRTPYFLVLGKNNRALFDELMRRGQIVHIEDINQTNSPTISTKTIDFRLYLLKTDKTTKIIVSFYRKGFMWHSPFREGDARIVLQKAQHHLNHTGEMDK